MSKEERKLKAKVDEYFEKYWSVSFEKFIENWKETSEALEYKDKEIERLNNIINELEKYLIKIRETSTPQERIMAKFVLEYIKILKREELDGKRPYDELDEILELERDNLELKGSDKE